MFPLHSSHKSALGYSISTGSVSISTPNATQREVDGIHAHSHRPTKENTLALKLGGRRGRAHESRLLTLSSGPPSHVASPVVRHSAPRSDPDANYPSHSIEPPKPLHQTTQALHRNTQATPPNDPRWSTTDSDV